MAATLLDSIIINEILVDPYGAPNYDTGGRYTVKSRLKRDQGCQGRIGQWCTAS